VFVLSVLQRLKNKLNALILTLTKCLVRDEAPNLKIEDITKCFHVRAAVRLERRAIDEYAAMVE
jgi:hypothetical protein